MAKASSTYLAVLKQLKENPLQHFSHMKIEKFGTGELIPFQPNNIQRILHARCEDQLKKTGRVRQIVLKPRRSGLSTYCLARFFRHSVLSENARIAVIAHDQPTSSTLFNMVRLFMRHYPKPIAPKVGYQGKQELQFPDLNIRWRLGSAGGNEIVGDAIKMLHCSEVSRWGDNAGDYAGALLRNVALADGTEIIFESTAKGVGGMFYEQYWGAHSGETPGGWEAQFFPWYAFDEYTLPFTTEAQREEFAYSVGKDPRYGDGEEEARLLDEEVTYDLGNGVHETFKVDLERLHWRRLAIDVNCQGSLPQFHQDYPSNPREAFLASGRQVFEAEILDRVRQRIQRSSPFQRYTIPTHRYEADGRTMRYFMEPKEHGELRIFRDPIPGHSYRIGCDVSEGIEISDRDTDFSVAQVLDAASLEQVAMLRTKVDPDLYAWMLVTLGAYYNDAILCVERNNHGLVTLRSLLDKHHYTQLYFETRVDERGGNKRTKRVGFLTTVKSRPLLIDTLKESLRDESLLIHCDQTLDELQTFVVTATGRLEAAAGSHDDAVMALGLAAWCASRIPARSMFRPQAVYEGAPVQKYRYFETV